MPPTEPICTGPNPVRPLDAARDAFEAELLDQAPYRLDQIRRHAVPEVIQAVCVHREWSLLAAHVRIPPERVMGDFKACASRRLSTRWLWKPRHVSAAIQYVVAGRGEAMSVFESHKL